MIVFEVEALALGQQAGKVSLVASNDALTQSRFGSIHGTGWRSFSGNSTKGIHPDKGDSLCIHAASETFSAAQFCCSFRIPSDRTNPALFGLFSGELAESLSSNGRSYSGV